MNEEGNKGQKTSWNRRLTGAGFEPRSDQIPKDASQKSGHPFTKGRLGNKGKKDRKLISEITTIKWAADGAAGAE